MESDNAEKSEEAAFKQRVEQLLKCPVCHETATEPKTLRCGHFYCAECINLLPIDDGRVTCASCGDTDDLNQLRSVDLCARLVNLLNTPLKAEPQLNGDTKADHIGDSPMKSQRDKRNSSSFEDSESGDENYVKRDDTMSEDGLDVVGEELPREASTPDKPPSPVRVTAIIHVLSDDEPELVKLTNEHREIKRSESQADGQSVRSDDHDTITSIPSVDETDRRMNSLEKDTEVDVLIPDTPCSRCNNKSCNCNCATSMLTPPVSMGSQQSVELSSDDSVIPLMRISRWAVDDSASNIEVADKNKIHVTRWTFDDNGSVQTFDGQGKKIKLLQCNKCNYSGISLSKLGFVFTLNVSKHRIEEYSGVNGKKIKSIKLERVCRDPHALDVMETGQVLVVDQESNKIIVYPNSRVNKPPTVIKHELMREPCDVAATKDCFVVTSMLTKSLLKLDLNGKLIWSYGLRGGSKGKLLKPHGVCVDEEGRIYVVDQGVNTIYRFTADGELEGKLCDKQNGTMKMPWYVSVRGGIVAVLYRHNIAATYEFY